MEIRKAIKGALTKVDKLLPSPIFYSFVMTRNERLLFDNTLKKSSGYLEFGMGGSTIRALQISKAEVFSIESSLDWINLLREYFFIRKMDGKRLSLFHIDIGPTKEWGKPVSDNSKHLFPDYSSKVFGLIDAKKIDTVLIDGRFRVACTLKTIQECQKNERLRILIHDFDRRTHYHIVLNYLDEVGRADSLRVFKPKADVDLGSLNRAYEEYKYNYA